jgi:mono/diheme cytochrome c family protein
MVRMVLPEGDAAAGQRAFADLKCASCHEVKGTRGLPPVEATEPGPDLGFSLKGVSRGAIATSIVTPNHVNVEAVELWTELTPEERVWLGPGQIPPRQKADTERSRMREYAGVMTVRELTDLVTFLHSAANSN